MNIDSQSAGTNPASAAAPAQPAAATAPAPAPTTNEAASPAGTPAATTPAATATQPGSFLTSGAAPAEAGDQSTTQGTPKAEGEAATGAPEKYEFAAPEGMQFDGELLDKFSQVAKEKNLSQADAQALADLGAEVAKKTRDAYTGQIEAAQKEWVTASRTDKEFGGDKLSENLSVAKRALETFGSPELSAMLDASGLGYHPEVIRAFFRVGQAISEDRLVQGANKPATGNPLEKMYPSMAKN